MLHLKSLPISPSIQLQNIGWNWALGTDTLPYITNEMVVVSAKEAEAYYQATNDLFEMYVAAGEHVLKHHRFDELGIPENLVELVKLSWDDDRNLFLYGRFDLAGGLNGQAIKLIEFNADTATCIPETGIVQWAHLKANGLDEQSQFNTLYESLVENFQLLLRLNPDKEPTLLLSTMEDYPEDDANVAVLGEAAREAGFHVDYAYITKVEFSAEEGIFKQHPDGSFERFDFWFKLVPWEYIGWDEPELAGILTNIVRKRLAIVLNPCYTLLFQSKAILKILWEIYPYHPLLLQTADRPLMAKPSVRKVRFGREGANVQILDEQGRVTQGTEGEYGEQSAVYQEFVQFPTDAAGRHYQAGVFFATEACGLGFRRGGQILDNTAQFTGHLITEKL
jgi:glutathionylspermidine synthase